MKANQRAIVAKFSAQENVVFIEEWKRFLKYDPNSGIWAELQPNALKRQLGEFVNELALEKNQSEIAYQTNNALLSSLSNILKGWQSKYGPQKENPKLFQTASGVLDFSTVPPELKPNSPDYFFQHGAKLKYDPSASCPKFMDFLRQALPDDDISLLQRYIGSIFLGHNIEHRILILKGTPGGGKSTLVTILERVLGLENVAYLRTQHLGGRFEFSGFLGKRLLTAKDVPGDTLSLKGAQFLKSLVGGDRLQAEIKYAGKAEVWGHFHVVIACNNSLRIALDGDEDAWRRRLLIINYVRPKAVTPIPNLAEHLLVTEGEGILAWMVQGAINQKKEVDETGGYALSKQQDARIESLIGESDTCRAFLNARVQKQENADISVQELSRAYFEYCRAQGWKPKAQAAVEKEMPDLVLEKFEIIKRHDIMREGKALRGYRHLALIP